MGEENKLILKVYSKVLTLLNPVAKNCGEEVVVEILKSAIDHYNSVESISNEKVNKEENEINSKSRYEKDKMGGFYGLVASTSNDSIDEEEKEKYYEDIRKQKKYDSPKIAEISSNESDDINKFGKIYRDIVNAREKTKNEEVENSMIYEQRPEVLEKVAADRRNNPIVDTRPNKTEEDKQPEEIHEFVEEPKEELDQESAKPYTKVRELDSTVTWNAEVASPGTLFK